MTPSHRPGMPWRTCCGAGSWWRRWPGGPTTTELVVAAARAGALGWLAAGYKTPEAMAAEIAAVRAATAEPFGVNVFVPGAPYPDRRTLAGYLDSLGPGLGDASWDDDGFDGKVAALLTDPPAVTSFTFGCPPPGVIRALQDAGSAVVITVTSPAEAALAEQGGADGLCVQGYEAGAHRGTFVNDDAPGRDRGLLALIGEVAAVTTLPQIAAGGTWARVRFRPCWPRARRPPSAGPPSCAARRAVRTPCTRLRWPIRATPPRL